MLLTVGVLVALGCLGWWALVGLVQALVRRLRG